MPRVYAYTTLYQDSFAPRYGSQMATYRIVTSFESVTGIAADRCTSTFHFQTSEGAHDVDTGAALIGHVAAAYETVQAPGTAKPSQYLSAELSRVTVPVGRAYNPMGGSPMSVQSWAGFTAAGVPTGLPAEVACCLTLQADLTDVLVEAPDDPDADSGIERPMSRRKGRTYFGPLTTQALSGSNPERPSTTLKNILLGFGYFLGNPSNPVLTAVGTELVVYSNPGFGGAAYPVILATVDDAFDVQRRRGVKPTAKVTKAV